MRHAFRWPSRSTTAPLGVSPTACSEIFKKKRRSAVAGGPRDGLPCRALVPEPTSICAWKRELEVQRAPRTRTASPTASPTKGWLLRGLLGERRSFPGVPAKPDGRFLDEELEGFPRPNVALSTSPLRCGNRSEARPIAFFSLQDLGACRRRTNAEDPCRSEGS